jgi:hypothetical protein
MATVKERKLIREITDLALDIGAGGYDVCVDYAGHVHALSVRIALRGSSDYVYYGDQIYLSGRKEIWRADHAISGLEEALKEIKQYHPQFDADGVKL